MSTPGLCYCGDNYADHTPFGCGYCNCRDYAEHATVTATRDALDIDDAFNEGRRRDNQPAAVQLARRRATS